MKGNKKTKQSLAEESEEFYESLIEKLTGDEPVQGVGKPLVGEDAAAAGRALMKDYIPENKN